MIFVDRKSVDKPTVLEDKIKIINKDGDEEFVDTKATKEFKKNNELAEKGEFDKFKYSVYKEKEVRKTLEVLFQGKCAYCESKFLHVYTGDIEHFRPKGEITEALPKKPGYYWLAAKWENLLLSCRHCNQTLIHEIYGITNTDAKGKLNQFPLDKGGKHVQSHINSKLEIEKEEEYRLLINPCIEDPEEYFEYNEEGVIKPKYSLGKEFQMAHTSIDVYALQRMALVQAREKVLLEIRLQIERVREALKNLNDSITDKSKGNKRLFYDKILKRELIKLKQYTNSDEEYAGMARYVIRNFINSFTSALPDSTSSMLL